ncbi:MAG TPA: hypothetical protein PLZ43_06695 [bacterium]|nr:hypothetical protein [bacterium]
MSEIIILANSLKYHGRCVAGIDLRTGEWVRPISRSDHEEVPESVAADFNLFDIVDIPLTEKQKKYTEFQRENWYYDENLTWNKMAEADAQDMKKYLESYLFYGQSKEVSPEYLKSINKSEWKSLQLLERFVTFTYKEFKNKDGSIDESFSAIFSENGLKVYLKSTDIMLNKNIKTKKLLGSNVTGNYLITVSTTPPFVLKGKTDLACYKLVAGAIKL